MRNNKIKINILFLCVLVFATNPLMAAANFTINIQDGPTEGFNDSTPVAAVAGNLGTTLGEQRLNVFKRAGDIWGRNLNSNITIVINAKFDPLTCSNQGAVLGSAGPTRLFANFANAPIANTWYYPALADSLADTNITNANDINATFNSSIDNGCLGGSSWYYGLDGSTPPNTTALLPVVLHELGHGLGSSTVTSGTTGAFSSGRPDIWTNFLYDTGAKQTWREMATNADRVASAVSDPTLVWNGPSVNAKFPEVLDPTIVTQAIVNSPGNISGVYNTSAAQFGPAVPAGAGLTANVILAEDGVANPDVNDGCETITNDLTGAIALVRRGECNFTVKVANAQAAGAIGVLIGNNVLIGIPPMGGTDGTITIPSLGISQVDADTIIAELPGVNITMDFNRSSHIGTNDSYVRNYAPNTFASGSSVSHWSTTATPNLLMEPNITATIFSEVDLTYNLFEDIGWNVVEDFIYADGFEGL